MHRPRGNPAWRLQSRPSWRMIGVQWATLLWDGLFELDAAELSVRIAQAAGVELEVIERGRPGRSAASYDPP